MMPLMLKFYLTCAASGVAVAFIGHFDKDPAHISGALLGKAFSDITGLSVGIGIQLGLNTIISQNHGRKANNENGLAIRQCRRALVFAYILACAAAFGSKPILQALDQPEHVLGPCQNFAIINLLSLPGFWFSATIGGALVNMEKTWASVIADTLGAVVNMVMTFVFLAFFQTGYLGAAFANVLASISSGLAVYIYVKYYGLEGDTWAVAPRSGDTPPAISLRQYLDIAIPSAFSLWAEWWANQILAIFAGLLPAGESAVPGSWQWHYCQLPGDCLHDLRRSTGVHDHARRQCGGSRGCQAHPGEHPGGRRHLLHLVWRSGVRPAVRGRGCARLVHG